MPDEVFSITPLHASLEAAQVPIDKMMHVLLPEVWMHECEIEVRENPQVGTVYLIRHVSVETTRWLRWRHDPETKARQFWWDNFPDEFRGADRALLDLGRAPAPPDTQVVQTYGRDPSLLDWWVSKMETLHKRSFTMNRVPIPDDQHSRAMRAAKLIVAHLLVVGVSKNPDAGEAEQALTREIADRLKDAMPKVISIVEDAMNSASCLSPVQPRRAPAPPRQFVPIIDYSRVLVDALTRNGRH